MTGRLTVPFTKRPYSPDAPDAPDATKWWHAVRSGMTAQERVEVPDGQDGRVAAVGGGDVDVPSNYIFFRESGKGVKGWKK